MLKKSILSTVVLFAVPLIAETPIYQSYENRVSAATSIGAAGIQYERVKQDALYWSVGSTFNSFSVDAAIGYNFSLDSEKTLTPYIGSSFVLTHMTEHSGLFMEKIGLKYDQAVNNLFSFGFDVSLFSALSRHSIGGFVAAAPLSFHLGDKRDWNIALTPYYVRAESKLFGVSATGAQLSFGYRF